MIRASTPRAPIHMVMTLYTSEQHTPSFTSAQDYVEYTKRALPELNHFVALASDNAISVQRDAVEKFRRLVSQARDSAACKSEAVSAVLRSAESSLTGKDGEAERRARQQRVLHVVEQQAEVRRRCCEV